MADPILIITAEDLGGRVRWTIEDRHGCKAERDTPAGIVLLAVDILEEWKKEQDKNVEP